MKKLETHFISGEGGFSVFPLIYTQLARSSIAAIYERSRDGKPRDYEVFKIKVARTGTRTFSRILKEDQEQYPSTSNWGKTAWTFNDRERAFAKYAELNKRQETIKAFAE